MIVSHEAIRQQILSILMAWGMNSEQASLSADLIADADLRGIDTHGISILPVYDDEKQTKAA